MGWFERLQGCALRNGGGSLVALCWGDLTNLAGHSMLDFWVDFKAQVANLSLFVSQKNAAPSLQPGLSLLSTPAGSDSNNQQTPGRTTLPRTSLMLRVFAWVLAAPEGSVSPKPLLPQQRHTMSGRAEMGLCPRGHANFSSCPTARPMCFGQLMGPLAWPGSSRISPAGGFNTPTPLGTTHFTLCDPKHCIFRSRAGSTWRMPGPCLAHSDKNTGVGGLLAPFRAQRHSLRWPNAC